MTTLSTNVNTTFLSDTQRAKAHQFNDDRARQQSVESLQRRIITQAANLDARLNSFKGRLVALMAWLGTGGFDPSVARSWTYLQQLDRLKKPIVARGQLLLAVEKALVEVESTLVTAEKKQDALEKEFDSIEKWAVAQKGYTPPSEVGRRK